MRNNAVRVLQIGDWEFGKNGIATLIYNFNQNLDTEKVIFDYVVPDKVNENYYKKNIENKKGKVYELEISKTGINKKILYFFKLIKFLKNNRYEIVHINESTAHMMLYYSLICKIAGIKKIILHSHSSGFDSGKRELKLIIHKISKLLLPLFTKNYLACSKTAAQWTFLKKHLNKVIIINNGIDTKKFKFNLDKRNEIRKELKIEENFVLGHVGRMSYQKNHEFLIEIFKEIKKIIPESKLLLIGTGPLESKLKEKVKKLNIKENILFLGLKSNVEDYFQAMDLFLLPSHFEGLGIVGVEAQTSGLFSVFSDVVPKEIRVTDLCEFISLEDKEKWLEIITLKKNKIYNYKRDNYFLEVKKNNYDIEDCIKELIKVYRKLGENKK